MSFSWPVFPGLDQDLFPPWFFWFWGFDSKTVQRSASALCRSRRELSNAYSLAKFSFDTAENKPCKNSNFLTSLTPEFSLFRSNRVRIKVGKILLSKYRDEVPCDAPASPGGPLVSLDGPDASRKCCDDPGRGTTKPSLRLFLYCCQHRFANFIRLR